MLKSLKANAFPLMFVSDDGSFRFLMLHSRNASISMNCKFKQILKSTAVSLEHL